MEKHPAHQYIIFLHFFYFWRQLCPRIFGSWSVSSRQKSMRIYNTDNTYELISAWFLSPDSPVLGSFYQYYHRHHCRHTGRILEDFHLPERQRRGGRDSSHGLRQRRHRRTTLQLRETPWEEVLLIFFILSVLIWESGSTKKVLEVRSEIQVVNTLWYTVDVAYVTLIHGGLDHEQQKWWVCERVAGDCQNHWSKNKACIRTTNPSPQVCKDRGEKKQL